MSMKSLPFLHNGEGSIEDNGKIKFSDNSLSNNSMKSEECLNEDFKILPISNTNSKKRRKS